MQTLVENYSQLILSHAALLLEQAENPLNELQLNSVKLINQYTQELSKAIKQSETLSPMELGHFMRHDVFNLLTPIVGYIEMLSDGWVGRLSPDQADHVEIILYAVRDMLHLIERQKMALAS